VLFVHLGAEILCVDMAEQNYKSPLVSSNQNQGQFLVGFTF
jgi:hypothetical protein